MSYPTKLKLFKAWAKAMEEGATVDRPNYGKTTRRGVGAQASKRRARRPRRKRFHRKRKKGQD